jgi:hypothetical protein
VTQKAHVNNILYSSKAQAYFRKESKLHNKRQSRDKVKLVVIKNEFNATRTKANKVNDPNIYRYNGFLS